jgi:molybdate transport system ATP-binding protein
MSIHVDIASTLRSGARTFQLRARVAAPAKRVVIYGASGAGKSQM